MKKVLLLIVLVFVGTAGWRIGNSLSSDAISMAVGIFFGVLAGIPTALLVLASDRHKAERNSRTTAFAQQGPAQPHAAYPGYGASHQPPVIIVNGTGEPVPQRPGRARAGYLADSNGFELAGRQPEEWYATGQGQRPGRRFKVVGEQEEWLE